MKIKISDLNQKLLAYFQGIGLNEADAQTLAQLTIDQEIIGNQFSAVGLATDNKKSLATHAASTGEEVVAEKAALQLLKGNGKYAPIITANHLDDVIAKAKTQGIYALGIYDSTYNHFFDVFCRRVAAQDCIAIIAENGGPQGVVPFGGRTEVTGTNPLAYGIPTHKYPIIFDAATAAHAYSRIKQAKAKGEQLLENTYVDKEGNVTTDPNVAYAVLPFGGFKGYAINVLLDVLSGALVRGKCGLDMPLDSERYIGTLVLVIDPAAFGELEDFKNATTKLVEDLLAVPAVDPAKPVRVPGIRGSERIEKLTKEGYVEIEDEVWERFEGACSKS